MVMANLGCVWLTIDDCVSAEDEISISPHSGFFFVVQMFHLVVFEF